MPEFPDPAALNVWLERWCMELCHEAQHGTLPVLHFDEKAVLTAV
ncbi:hypothetical protein Q9299_20420 [Gemmobacter fulvus]|nr:hypothetical protein [Gemmobacter fulvus]MDQ1850673.1 hypothetical protein [Gemmobacter fulvus]